MMTTRAMALWMRCSSRKRKTSDGEEQPRGDSRLFFCANKHLESAYCCGVFLDKIAWGGGKMEKWKIADHFIICEFRKK